MGSHFEAINEGSSGTLRFQVQESWTKTQINRPIFLSVTFSQCSTFPTSTITLTSGEEEVEEDGPTGIEAMYSPPFELVSAPLPSAPSMDPKVNDWVGGIEE